MLKNIRNYSALLLLSLVVLGNTISASAASTNARGFELINVENKAYNFFNRILSSRSPQSFRLTVKEGQESVVRINSLEGVSMKLYLPGGEIKEYREEKCFSLEFHAAGEYVLELNSAATSKYTMKISTK